MRAGARTLEVFVGDAYRAWFSFLVEDELMFKLMQRNAGPIRSLFGDPILGAGVEELLEDLRAAIDRGDLPPLDADYMAGAMAGAALELGVRMAEREPADVEGAARFATELFLGGISRMAGGAAGLRRWRRQRAAARRAGAAAQAAHGHGETGPRSGLRRRPAAAARVARRLRLPEPDRGADWPSPTRRGHVGAAHRRPRRSGASPA